MTILTLEQFGKPFVVLDDSKITAATCHDAQELLDFPLHAEAQRYFIRVICDGGPIDIGFKSADRANWSMCYFTLVAALYRASGEPMKARVPSPDIEE